ncbi:calcium-binding protein [Mesorhizobium sp. LHD-90]|uniref:calcium-binding protein n=1 Tax=Mesorhizobium sp. LHD-90 TaxID=3071414 RepID=UPI0027DEFA2D|nr:calcium-binding protein [Mesorhizobium sp. LHD-90]MDQ6432507.1 calcium-binding protein [Mesorhizobium sp. LHD-90]
MATTSTYAHVFVKPEFQANSFETGNQLRPDVTGLSNGGFAVVYNNGILADGEVLVDFYDAGNERIGSFKVPYENGTMAAGQPQITELANGNVLVTWIDAEAPILNLRGRIFEADGTAVGSEIAIDTVGSDVHVTALAGGGFVVADTRADNVWQTRFDSLGNEFSPSAMVNNPALAGVQTGAAVAALSTGSYVVTYTDTNPAEQTLRARIYYNDGTTKVNDFAIDSIGDNTEASAVGLADGNWAVAYTDTGWGAADAGNSGITLKILNNDGNDLTGFIRVNAPSAEVDVEPDVTVLENGFIVVSWSRNLGLVDYGVMARVFTAAGVAVTDEFALDLGPSADRHSAISGLLSGKFVTTWQDSSPDGGVDGRIGASVSEIVRTTTGDDDADTFAGDALRDVIDGAGSGDFLDGAGGNDLIDGGSGDDQLLGGDGADVLIGGEGADILEGGEGTDTASYASAAAGVIASLANPAINGGDAAGDTYNAIENLIGSGHGDALNGNNSVNDIRGGAGEDTLKGYAGNDKLYGQDNDDTLIGGVGGDRLSGGSGSDTASYLGATAGVTANLADAAANTGDAAGDTYLSIEHLTGSGFVDKLIGNAGDNRLDGGAGNDTLYGGDGADQLIGGADTDTVNYSGSAAGVIASLANAAINTGFAAGDSYTSIENISGTKYDDYVYGNAGANVVNGGAGDDFIKGYAGNDTLVGGAGGDAFIFNTALDAAANVDKITDFDAAADTIQLDNAIFAAMAKTGPLASAYFRANASGTAQDGNDHIVYETDTGKLFYDADGNGAGGAIHFATLTGNPALGAADFVVF